MSLRKLFVILGSIAMCSNAWSCNAAGAFGAEFGAPVPAGASAVKDMYFQGGTGLVSFAAPVPAPLSGFENYAYWSNRDRKAVYAIVAYRRLIADQKLLFDDSYRGVVLEKAKVEIAQLAKSWEEAYGLVYHAESAKGLTWSAENQDVRSKIGTMGGEFLYVECEHKQLQKAAWGNALRN